MRTLILLALALALVGAAAAFDLGSVRPLKPFIAYPENVPDPAVLRQGGDTIAQATPIVVGSALDGTTTGFINDYDEVCPYTGGMAPDVVYTFTPEANIGVTVDMYGSAYDTKIYIYDEDLGLIACNDDYYPDYTSRVEDVPVVGGAPYYLVIDGYGSDNGIYHGYIEEYVPCALDCPAGAQLEGEPPLVDDYVDALNGGCGSNPVNFQAITSPVFCATSGYYQSSGSPARDTDWFHIIMPAGGVLEVTGNAEEYMNMFELGPQDCNSVEVIQTAWLIPCQPATMTITGPGGSLVWFWCGPQNFWEGNTYEFDYVLFVDTEVAVENHSWTDVKGLFD
ncbi:MAG TPA: hypothetical protein PLL30_15005 [Candidatus Krumholzibacteria bacterium]|nr:hypothetical protein [Candidatus Krumholzibacteria bacterium]HPD73078.1 hypothetical protein [Candidatus Krumholzibacteria bacterium]HRY41878.1 hypothetical protein [Candidatus Krumholzibacteria bacterium]